MSEEELMKKYKYGYKHSKDLLNEPYVKDLQQQLSQKQKEIQNLKNKNELEFNDFIKFKKEQADEHLEETNTLIKEKYHCLINITREK